jgi:hypothetical protein
MMKKLIKYVVMIMATLWLGAYIMHSIPTGAWYELPTAVTLFLVMMLNIGVLALNIVLILHPDKP